MALVDCLRFKGRYLHQRGAAKAQTIMAIAMNGLSESEVTMAIWDDAITERDKLVLDACGYGRVRGLGKRPALVVIDMNYNWVGDRREPVLESIKRIRHSCGEEA